MRADVGGIWFRYAVTAQLMRVIKEECRNTPQNNEEVDQAIERIKGRLKRDVFDHAEDDHTNCGDHNGAGDAWFAKPKHTRVVTCKGDKRRMRELVDTVVIQQLKLVIIPEFGLKTTNVSTRHNARSIGCSLAVYYIIDW